MLTVWCIIYIFYTLTKIVMLFKFGIFDKMIKTLLVSFSSLVEIFIKMIKLFYKKKKYLLNFILSNHFYVSLTIYILLVYTEYMT